jgi:hypothetical protein
MSPPSLDLDRLLKLRVVVARFGESDASGAGWWFTQGQLGKLGAAAVRRGLPRTHHFAQARSVFSVAEARCREVFFPPRCVNLFHLPEQLEEAFESRWESWLDDAPRWHDFFDKIATLSSSDLVVVLRELELVDAADLDAFARLPRSMDKPAVALASPFASTTAEVALLALGFARGAKSDLVVPYARRSDA